MSNASIGCPALIALVMELDPLSVYRKARTSIIRFPESLPAVTTYAQAFEDLSGDRVCIEVIKP